MSMDIVTLRRILAIIAIILVVASFIISGPLVAVAVVILGVAVLV